MKALANENFPFRSVLYLRALGHDVLSISESCPGISDDEVLELARSQGRIILTFDRDYGELLYRRRLDPPPGLVYLRFVPVTPIEPGKRIHSVLSHGAIALEGKFTVITREMLRQRPLAQR